MSNDTRARRGTAPIARANETIQALMRVLRQHLPGVALAGVVTAEVAYRAIDVIKKHILPILGTGFLTAALAMLLPSLLVVAVNAIGFTTAGVLKGSLAALIQSAVYGGSTGGLFSIVQGFGATAAVASPAAIGIGVTLGVVGLGVLGYWWYKRRQDRRATVASGSDISSKRKESSEMQVAVRQKNNFFDFFRWRA